MNNNFPLLPLIFCIAMIFVSMWAANQFKNPLGTIVLISLYLLSVLFFATYYHVATPRDLLFTSIDKELSREFHSHEETEFVYGFFKSKPHKYRKLVEILQNSIFIRSPNSQEVIHFIYDGELPKHIVTNRNDEVLYEYIIDYRNIKFKNDNIAIVPILKKEPSKLAKPARNDKVKLDDNSLKLLKELVNKSQIPPIVGDSFARCFYFSATTITTLGYGDIVPLTGKARWATSLEAILGIIMLGLFVAKAASNSTQREN